MAGRRPGHLRARSPAPRRSPTAGSSCPAWSTPTATSASPRRRPDRARSTRPVSWPRSDRDAGVLALRDAGSPYPYPELDDEPDLPRLARAGRHVAPPKRYLRDIGRGGRRGGGGRGGGRAGRRRQRLGQAGRRLDRPGRRRPRAGLGRRTRWPPPSAAAHAAGVRAAVHTFSESAVEIMVRAGVDSVEHGTGLSLDLIDEMARQGTALVPTMINIRTFGGIAAAGPGQVPRVRRPHARPARRFPRGGARRPRGRGADLRGHRRGRRHRPRAGRRGDAAAAPAGRHVRRRRARRRLLAGPGVARLPRPGRGRPGGPGRLSAGPPPRPGRGAHPAGSSCAAGWSADRPRRSPTVGPRTG